MAHYCLQKFQILPSQYLALSREDRAFIVASAKMKKKSDDEELKKIKK